MGFWKTENMFQEYNMATRARFSKYFGFMDIEVDELYRIYMRITDNPWITREDLRHLKHVKTTRTKMI